MILCMSFVIPINYLDTLSHSRNIVATISTIYKLIDYLLYLQIEMSKKQPWNKLLNLQITTALLV